MLDSIKAVTETFLPHLLLPSDPEKLAQEDAEMVRKSLKEDKKTETAKKHAATKKTVNVKKTEAKSQPSKVKKA